jgi:hypothetical protein
VRLNNVNCYSGSIKVVGLDAVVGIFSAATLERRGENGQGQPVWTLHAVLSYENETLIKSDAFTKKYMVEPWKDKVYQAVPEPGVAITYDGGHLIIDGVTLCLPEQKPQQT